MSVATGCNPPDDPDSVASGFTDSSGNGTGNSGTETQSSDESDDTGTDDGGQDCAALDCGFGAGIENPDPMTRASDPCICECSPGYINQGGATPCELDVNCIEVRPLECRTSIDEGSAVGMIFSLEYCSGEPKTDLDIIPASTLEEAADAIVKAVGA